MRSSLVIVTLSLVAGIAAGREVLFFPFTTGVAAAAAAGALLLLARRGNLGVPAAVLAPAVFLGGMTVYVLSAAPVTADHVLSFDRRHHIVTGRIISPLDRDPDRTAFTIAASAIDGRPCSERIRVTVRDGEPAAGFGDTVRIAGRIREAAGSLVPGGFDYRAHLARQGIRTLVTVRDFRSVDVLERGRGVFRMIQDRREEIRQRFLASTSGPGSAVLQAMVLGEEGLLTDEIRDRFMAAGVTHILSISGSHLGLVALICFAALRRGFRMLPERVFLRLSLHADLRKAAALCAVPPVVFYALLAGGQTATLRSLAMILAGLSAAVLDRENRILHALAGAALCMLAVSPQSLFDISFQLSYLSVLAIGGTVHILGVLPRETRGLWARLRRGALTLLGVSLTAGLATGPLVMYHFNQVSLIGVLANMVVVPFAGFVVVPVGLASGLLSLVLGDLPFAALSQHAADAFVRLVTFFSRMPFAELRVPSPPVPFLLAFFAFFVCAGAALRARLLARFHPFTSSARIPAAAVAGMAGAALLCMLSLLPSLLPDHAVRITFLDVGQGDCALIELPSGETVLVDGGGTRDNRFDIGRRIVAPFLWDRGVRTIDHMVLSHPHPDHLNGLRFITERFRVAAFWESGRDHDLPEYAELRRILDARGIPARAIARGDEIPLRAPAVLRVLHPDARAGTGGNAGGYRAENDRSLVLSFTVRGVIALFTGDVDGDTLASLSRAGADLRCDLLKVPHHGSRFSPPEAVFRHGRPAAAVASAGRNNPHGHPSDDLVDRCAREGVPLFRTDRHGTVLARIDDTGLHVAAWADLLPELISIGDGRSWRGVEQRNWKRFFERLSW